MKTGFAETSVEMGQRRKKVKAAGEIHNSLETEKAFLLWNPMFTNVFLEKKLDYLTLKQVKGSLSRDANIHLNMNFEEHPRLKCTIPAMWDFQGDSMIFIFSPCTWRLMLIQSVKPGIYWAHKDGSHLGCLCLLGFVNCI